MEKAKELLAELKPLMSKFDKESETRRDEIAAWFKEHKDEPGVEEAFNNFMDAGLTEIESDVNRLREQMEDKYSLLPIAYIARHYFGKSRAWLCQRLNGNEVRGKVYTLNAEQKNTFNNAVQDIARQIGSVHLA